MDVKLVRVPLPSEVAPVIVVELMGPPGFVVPVGILLVSVVIETLVVAVMDESLEEMSDDMGKLVVNEPVALVMERPSVSVLVPVCGMPLYS